jgi:hypothetical protein
MKVKKTITAWVDEDAAQEEHDAQVKIIEMIVGSTALTKSCFDSFDYAIKLKTGDVIRFTHSRVINREWIHLHLDTYPEQPKVDQLAYPAKRGIDVRLADIVWVMDGPEGS